MEAIQAADEGVLFSFENHRWSAGDPIMKVITHLGDPATVIALVLAAMLFFFLSGRSRTALILLLASLLGMGIAETTKRVIRRERPDVAWRVIKRPSTASFPSGHALNSMAIYGSLALLVSRQLRRPLLAGLVLVLGFVLPVLIGFSRPYLGVHYPSDVLAGWTAGLACALLALWADRRWGDPIHFESRMNPPSVPPTSLPAPGGGSEGIRSAGEVTGIISQG
jgi:undecaprenyl-diphosphatase